MPFLGDFGILRKGGPLDHASSVYLFKKKKIIFFLNYFKVIIMASMLKNNIMQRFPPF